MKYIFSEGGDFLRIIAIALFYIILFYSVHKSQINKKKQKKNYKILANKKNNLISKTVAHKIS